MAGAVGSETFVVYREAGFLLIAVALVLFMLGGRSKKGGPVVVSLLLACVVPLDAGESWLESGFEKARELQVAGRFDEALEGAQSAESLLQMRIYLAAIPIAGLVLAFVFLMRFGLTHQRSGEIRVELEKRRGSIG